MYFQYTTQNKKMLLQNALFSFISTGYPRGWTLIGINNRDYMDQKTAKIVYRKFNKVYRTGKPVKGIEWESIRKDGTKRYVESTAILMKDSNGKPVGFRGIVADITERKLAEEALRKSEKQYRTLIKNAGEAIIVAQDGIFKFANPKGEELYGRSQEELASRPLTDFIHEEDRDMVRKRHKRRLGGEEPPMTYPFRIINKAGDTKWVQLSAALFSWKNKPAVLCYMTDITDRKRAEEDARAHAQRLALHVKYTPLGVIEWDLDFKATEWNTAAATIFGYSRHEALGRHAADLVIPDSALKHVDLIWSALIEGKGGTRSTNENKTKGGEIRVCDWYNTTLIDPEGAIIGVASLVQDITEQKQAEEALRKSEEKYRTVLEANPDPVVVYDKEGKVTYMNPAFTRVFGWSLEERIGKKMDDFVPEEKWPEIRMMIDKVLAGERFLRLETLRYTKDKKSIPVAISASFDRDKEGDLLSSVVNLRDISEQKRLEAQLQKVQKMEAIATLAGGIAHEFNNSLTGVVGNIELLEMRLPGNKTVKEHTEPMKSSSQRMANLTSQLLAYARGGKYQAKTISLGDFVEKTLPVIKSNIGHSIQIDTVLQRNLFKVNVDSTQMQMVLSALVSNSSEAIEGEGRIRITAGNEEIDAEFANSQPELKAGRYVCLTVEDDGGGMGEEALNKIFDPFYTTKFIGRGLGMASVFGIIMNHGGSISVESDLGKGTVVRIYFPAFEDKEEERPEKPAEEAGVISGTGTILVIEDEETVMNLIRAVLERLGYRMLEAKTGREAVEIAKTFDGDIDLALLDIKLPDIQGDKVYPLIMEDRPNLKVIVCSGYSIETARGILDAGAQDFIQKPFNVKELSQKLREIIDRE